MVKLTRGFGAARAGVIALAAGGAVLASACGSSGTTADSGLIATDAGSPQDAASSSGQDAANSSGQDATNSSGQDATNSNGQDANSGGPDGGAADAAGQDAAPKPYCDGLAVNDGMGNAVYLETFGFGGTLDTQGCADTINGYSDGTAIQQIVGIYDLDTSDNGAMPAAAALFPSNCGDLGLPGYTPEAPRAYMPPSGSSSIAAAYGNANVSKIYGIVTAVYGWAAGASPHSGTLYLQDPAPAAGAPPPRSGVQVYFPKGHAATYGAVPNLGDVAEVTGVMWSPFHGVNQFAASATTQVTVIGAAALPTPISVTATVVGPNTSVGTQGYEGMRVKVNGGPFSVHGSRTSSTCPPGLQYTPGG
jgi:hypothetical protein